MLPTDTGIRRQRGRRRWAWVCVAVVLLNASVTFHNAWPTLAVHWQGELSLELAVLLLLLALSNAWLGPTPRRLLAVLSGSSSSLH